MNLSETSKIKSLNVILLQNLKACCHCPFYYIPSFGIFRDWLKNANSWKAIYVEHSRSNDMHSQKEVSYFLKRYFSLLEIYLRTLKLFESHSQFNHPQNKSIQDSFLIYGYRLIGKGLWYRTKIFNWLLGKNGTCPISIPRKKDITQYFFLSSNFNKAYSIEVLAWYYLVNFVFNPS